MPLFSSVIRRVRNLGGLKFRWTVLCGLLSLLAMGFFWREICSVYVKSRGKSELYARRIPEATGWFKSAELLVPKDAETHFLLARASRLAGKFMDMQSHLSRAKELGFDAERLRREHLLAIAQSGKVREIEPQIADLFSSPGEDGREICEAVVSGMFACYRLQEAFSVLGAWRRDFPQDPQPDFVAGMYSFQAGAWLKAAESFEAALKLAPGRIDARLHLADALLHVHRIDEAHRHFSDCLKSNPTNSTALVGLGQCLIKKGDVSEAEKVFLKALKIDPGNPGATVHMAELKVNSGDGEAALPYAKAAFELKPYDPEVRYILAQALQSCGKTEEAREQFRFVEAQQEGQSQLRNMLEELERNPSNISLRCEIGQTLLKFGNPDEGVGWLYSALEYSPKHARACRILADHFRKSGKDKEADELERRLETRDSTAQSAAPEK